MSPPNSPNIVFLSPHLDDAVLSAGGLIARSAAQGRRVEVWTFFTDGPPLDQIPPRRRVFGDYAVRRAEDERALARLGAGHRWLGLRERIWREPQLSSVMHIFRTPEAAAAFVNLGRIKGLIEPLLDRPEVLVYAPLAAGNHCDHVEVALAAIQVLFAKRAFDRFRFYEDFYATGTAARRRHFVTRRRSWGLFDAPAWASPAIGAVLRVGAWSARGPGIDDYLPAASAWAWTSAAEPVEAFEAIKLNAVAEYSSQVTALGGMKRLEPFLRRSHNIWGGELMWRAAPQANGSP